MMMMIMMTTMMTMLTPIEALADPQTLTPCQDDDVHDDYDNDDDGDGELSVAKTDQGL